MSNTVELKNYLIIKNKFLFKPENNGKTIMLSGAWGAGKTHFWQEDILKGKQGLFEQLKDKACVYISLYGKDSLEAIKKEVLIKASLDRKKEDLLSKEVSTFGFEALSSISNSDLKIGKAIAAVKDLANWVKSNKGIDKLKDGGVICFDDFERKSKEIDLNDLFGFISQLALEYKCKVIIILNSDVFEGEESNKFVEVKEKTVSKFFHFEPTPIELFESIFNIQDSQEKMKYESLKPYYEDILSAIIETKELNARIYIQVLDNCLEWINGKNDNSVLQILTLSTTFFIKNHEVLDFRIVQKDKKQHNIVTYFLDEGYYDIANFLQNTAPQLFSSDTSCACKESIQMMNSHLNKSKKEDKEVRPDDYYRRQNKVFDENKNFFRDFIFYIYVLKIDERVSQDEFEKINKFVKTGILPKQTKEVETSVPPEAMAEEKA